MELGDKRGKGTDFMNLPRAVTGHGGVPNVHYVFLFNSTHFQYHRVGKMLLRFHRQAASFTQCDQRLVSWFLSTGAYLFPEVKKYLLHRKPQPQQRLPPICYVEVPDDAELGDYLLSYCGGNAQIPVSCYTESSNELAIAMFCLTTSFLKVGNCGGPDAPTKFKANLESYVAKNPGIPRDVIRRDLPDASAVMFLHRLLAPLTALRLVVFRAVKAAVRGTPTCNAAYGWLLEKMSSCSLYSISLIKRELIDCNHPFLQHPLAVKEVKAFERNVRYPFPVADWPYVEFLMPNEYPQVDDAYPTLEAAAVYLAMKHGNLSLPEHDHEIVEKVNSGNSASEIFPLIDEAEAKSRSS